MGAVDYYPDEEGHIADGLIIGFCKAGMSITANQAVDFGTTAASYLVATTAALNTGVGVAMKAANTDEYVPVCFYGVCKMTADTPTGTTTAAGHPVVSATTVNYVCGLTTLTSVTDIQMATNNGAGTIHMLGMSLQTATTVGDEILILVGGAR